MARTAESIQKDDENKVDLEKPEDIVDEGQQTKPDAGPTPEEVAADLRKQLEDANARADREAEARRVAEENTGAAVNKQRASFQNEIVTRETAIASKIDAAKTKLDSTKQQLKQAKSAGDSDAEVELQDALTNARYELNAAEWEKNQFTAWKTNAEKQAQNAPQGSQRTSPYTDAEQAWISRHPEFNSSKKFARLAKLAAQEARDEGHAQDSKGYFDYIEGALKEDGLLGTKDPTSGADNAGAASTATPPNRNGAAGGPVIVNKNSKYPYIPKGFTVPKEWVDAANDQGFDDPLEYANERIKIESEEKGRTN